MRHLIWVTLLFISLPIDAQSLKLTIDQAQKGEITSLKRSNNGRWVFSSSTDGSIFIRDAKLGALASSIEHQHAGKISTLLVPKDGNLFFSLGSDGNILSHYWKTIDSIQTTIWKHVGKEITTGCLSLDNKYIYVGNIDGEVLKWNISKEKLMWKYKMNGYISFISTNKDGKKIFIGTEREGYQVISNNGKRIFFQKKLNYKVAEYCISNGRKHIAYYSKLGAIEQVDLDDFSTVKKSLFQEDIDLIMYKEDSLLIIGKLHIYLVQEEGLPLILGTNPTQEITVVATDIFHQKRFLFIGTKSGNVYLIDLKYVKINEQFIKQTQPKYHQLGTFTNEVEELVIYLNSENELIFFNTSNGALTRLNEAITTFVTQSTQPQKWHFDHRSHTLFTLEDLAGKEAIYLGNDSIIRPFINIDDYFLFDKSCLSFDESTRQLFVANKDGVIRVWDLADNKMYKTLFTQAYLASMGKSVSHIIFNDSLIISVDEYKEVNIWRKPRFTFIESLNLDSLNHPKEIRLSPTDPTLAIRTYEGLYLVDVFKHESVKIADNKDINSVRFSLDGESLYFSDPQGLYKLNIHDRSLIQTITPTKGRIQYADFDPQNEHVLLTLVEPSERGANAWRKRIWIENWDIKKNKADEILDLTNILDVDKASPYIPNLTFLEESETPHRIYFTKNGYLIENYKDGSLQRFAKNTVGKWEVFDIMKQRKEAIKTVKIANDGRYMLINDHKMHVLPTGLEIAPSEITDSLKLKEGSSSWDLDYNLFSPSVHRKSNKYEGADGAEMEVIRESPYGHYLVGKINTEYFFVNTETKKTKPIYNSNPIFSNTGEYLMCLSFKSIEIWRCSPFLFIDEIEFPESVLFSFALPFDHTSQQFAFTTSNGKTSIYSIGKRRIIQENILTTVPSYVSFAPGDSQLILFNEVNILIWDINNERKCGEIFIYDEPDGFIGYSPEGYYMRRGVNKKLMAAFKDDKVFQMEDFDLKYNRPDMFLKNLPNSNESLIQIYRQLYYKRLKKYNFTENMLSEDYHIPECYIVSENRLPINTDKDQQSLQLQATDSLRPLDRLNVFVNNVPIYGVQGINLRDLNTRKYTITLDILLSRGENKIQVSALNQVGAESLKATTFITYDAPEVKPALYLITIGISDYQADGKDLQYAAKDAQDIVNFYSTSTGFDQIHTRSLTDQQVTKANILALRDFLEQSHVDDQVLIYLSGHGLLDSTYDFYYATHDMDFANPSEKGILYDDIEGLLDGIPARKKLLLIDACHSGEYDADAQPLTQAQQDSLKAKGIAYKGFKKGDNEGGPVLGLQNSFEMMQQLFADLRRGSGATVISSSSGMQFSYEDPEWQNGAFTYVFLRGLKTMEADTDGDGQVTASEVQNYLAEFVPRLTEGLQVPTFRRENLEYDFRVW